MEGVPPVTPPSPPATRDAPILNRGPGAPVVTAGTARSAAPAGVSLSAEPAAPLAPAGARPAAPRHPAAPRPVVRAPRRYRLRGRHIREHRMVRVGLALAAADIAVADDLLVLQVLRLQPLADLDAAQVCALSALPPSIVASSLDRLVRSGLARDLLVDGRIRFGLP